jgi:hypothetical protein
MAAAVIWSGVHSHIVNTLGDGLIRLNGSSLNLAKDRFAISETGTGFAYAKLSGGQKPCPPVAYAPVVRMTQNAKLSGSQKPSPARSRYSLCQDDTAVMLVGGGSIAGGPP